MAYDAYTGDTSLNINLLGGAPDYPTSDVINVFGPIYTPRIYGYKTSALELASSGNVTIALNDVHALDLYNDSNTNFTYFSSVSNQSLKLIAGPLENTSLSFNASNHDVDLYAQRNFTSTSSNSYYVNSAKGTHFSVGSNFSVVANSNISLASTATSVSLDGNGGKATFIVDGGNSNIIAFAENDATFTACNAMTYTACNTLTAKALNNATLQSTSQSVILSADTNNVNLTLDHVTHSILGISSGATHFKASTNFVVDAAQAATIAASNGATLASATSNVFLSGGNDVVATAAQDVLITATAGALSNTSAGDFAVSAGTDIVGTAANNVKFTATSGTLCNITLTGNMAFVSQEDLLLQSDNNLTQQSINGWSSNISANGYAIKATGGIVDIQSTTSDINIQSGAGSNKLQIALNQTTGVMTLTAPGGVQLSSSGNSVQNTDSAYVFNVLGNERFRINNDGVYITGTLNVTGSINSQDIVQTNLMVQDKTITLAVDSNNASNVVVDGTANNESGVIISGLPTGESNDLVGRYEKSIKWKYGVTGTVDLGGPKIKADQESYWDVRGGQLRLTHQKASGNKIAFGWRVNNLDELEFVKFIMSGSNADKSHKVIAKFGNTGTVIA